MNWRRAARKTIDRALKEGKTKGLEGPSLKKFVAGHYPFGERAMWPYKVWLSELKKTFPPSRDGRTTNQQGLSLPLFDEHPFLVMPGREDGLPES
jgi:hypothetical protein